MSRLIQDLRHALRSFLKAPGFTAIAVSVLALGIGANSATFTIVNALVFRPLPTQADDVVGLYRSDRSKPDSFRAFSYPHYVDVREQNDVLAGLAAHTFSAAGESAGDTTRRMFVELVSANYFETLNVPLAAGRAFLAEEEHPRANVPVAIVGYERWRKAGFDPNFIGTTIRINSVDFTVVGIAPQGFTGTMALVSPELWLPLGTYDAVATGLFGAAGAGLADRKAGVLTLIGRLKRGVTMETASERLDLLATRLGEADPDNRDQAITIARLPRMTNSTRPQSDTGLGVVGAALMGLAGTVLLIACLNLANMLLARGTSRKKEIAIRLAVGGARSRIVRQLLTESLLLAVTGAAAGLVFAYWSTTYLVASLARVMPLPVVLDSRPDMNVLLATSGFVAFATLVAGIGPALTLSRPNLVDDLKEQASELGSRPGAFSARNVLVVAQLALSLGLLVTGGLFARSAFRAAASDPGFSYDGAIVGATDTGIARLDEARSREVYRQVLDRVRSLPGVEAASLASTVPFGNIHEGRMVERPGIKNDMKHGPTYRVIGADYFRALGLRMIRGREFTSAEEDSPNAPRVAIIDDVLAGQLFPNEDPVGQVIRLVAREGSPRAGDNETYQVVGVSPTMREELLDKSADPHIFVPYGRHYGAERHLHVRGAGDDERATLALVDAIRRELRAVDAQLPVLRLQTLRQFHEEGLELWGLRTASRIFMAFGLLALGLAVAGVYGVKSYLVSRRTREIGIRMALGARPADVLGMVMRESTGLTLAGLVVGLPIAFAMGRVLGSVIMDVSSFDPVVFVTAPLLLALASMVASYVPARRATRVNPLSALRAD